MKHRRWPFFVLGFLVLLFGLGCLNYTKAESIEHHRAQAERYNLPPPAPPIRLLGTACVALGGGLIGFGFGRRTSDPASERRLPS